MLLTLIAGVSSIVIGGDVRTEDKGLESCPHVPFPF